ncbi:MAG: bifunctional diaminohydroxyphosphoribosylaminopyrimidine deaminase/5-amino-6-(5-phosphoribosylamino)uracil reductase RibD, partial [Parasphingopyxis sp.]
AKPVRVIIAAHDPDPRTDGKGIAALEAAGVAVETGLLEPEARGAMAGFFTRQEKGRPHITLKLAMSIDGRIALPSGESRWITGEDARAHAHLERARHEVIVVGGGTVRADAPRLTVRLPGLEDRSPRRAVLSNDKAWAEGLEGEWIHLPRPEAIADLERADHVLVEGGAGAAAAFLAADLVDRLLVYRAPILIGAGQAAVGDIGLDRLADAHGRWRQTDSRPLGKDRLEVYERA